MSNLLEIDNLLRELFVSNKIGQNKESTNDDKNEKKLLDDKTKQSNFKIKDKRKKRQSDEDFDMLNFGKLGINDETKKQKKSYVSSEFIDDSDDFDDTAFFIAETERRKKYLRKFE